MASLASLLALGLRLTIPAAAAPLEARDDAPSVTIANGTYIGLHSPEYDQDFFLGIPYAQTPDRFTPSQSLNSTWDGTRNATAYPPHCPGFGSDDWGYEQSEDCLYLNIVKPAGVSSTEGVPVMLWIHGGGLFMGGSADRRYNLSFIVENSVEMGTPVIGVSINYRLSAYGFLCGQEALDAGLTNIGFRDQRLAIQWVHENIAAFGGDPDKVTIFGESSGAESVSAQVLAYNGRDDGLFRAAIAQSGMGGAIYRYPGGFNATEAMQTTFNSLVLNTSCSSFVGTADTIPCLRQLPLEEINSTIASVIASAGAFPPVLDGDFIADYPTNQLNSGAFPKIPILIGTNTDEGSGFGGGSGPNTDAEFRARIERVLWSKLGNETINDIVDQVAAVYPDIQAVGIPALSSWPTVILPGSEEAKTFGLQYRRTNAFFGDLYFQHGRRRSNIAWSEAGVPSYAYDFNVTVNPLPAFISSTHFQEVAFVFLNLRGDGYSSNPFANKPDSYQQLAKAISSAWVNFAVGLNPNGDGTTGLPEWPVYNTATGGGVGSNMKLQVENAHVELDKFRAEGIEWFRQNALSVFGN